MLGALILSSIHLVLDVERSPEMSFSRTPLWGRLGGFQFGAARFVILLFSIAAALE